MNTDQTYHTTAVVQQRREEAAAINAAMNPAPAGKLTDEQLANAAAESCLKYMTAETRIECDYAAESFAKHQPARAAFARAVREAVEAKQAEEITSLLKDKADAIAMAQAAERETSREQDMRSKDREEIARLTAIIEQSIEMVNTPGTTKDNLPKAINAKIMQRDEFHDATLKKLDVAKAEISRLKTEYESLLKVYKNADEGARNMHSELKRLQSASRMCTADMDALKDQLAKANAELERLRKPVFAAGVLLSRQLDGALSTSISLHIREGVSNEDEMRGIAAQSALRLKPGFAIDSILVQSFTPACPPPAPSADQIERSKFEEAHKGEVLADKESNWRTWKLAKNDFDKPEPMQDNEK